MEIVTDSILFGLSRTVDRTENMVEEEQGN